jgi:hypothetical protein
MNWDVFRRRWQWPNVPRESGGLAAPQSLNAVLSRRLWLFSREERLSVALLLTHDDKALMAPTQR